MKTTKLFLSLSVIALAAGLMFTSCKKRQAFKDEDGQASADNSTANSENDAAISDVNDVISNTPLMKGKSSDPNNTNGTNGILGNICGLSVDTNGAYIGTIKLNYQGIVCNNRKREGSIKLTIVDYASGKRWKQANTVLKVEYLNYKVTRASDGKSVKLNGTQYVTNISGGTWFELIFLGQADLVHSVTGTNLNVTFDEDKTAVYNIHRKFTYTWGNSVLTAKGEGIGSFNSLSNLENYGTTRNGETFTSQVKTPIIWNTTCGAWAPIQGNVEIKVDSKEFALNVTFGVDGSGNPVSVGANACPYGWKVEWTRKNKTNKKIIGYK